MIGLPIRKRPRPTERSSQSVNLPGTSFLLIFMGIAAVMPPSPAEAQGILVDRRPDIRFSRSFEIREVRIQGRVRDQVAELQLTQTFRNPGSTVLEVEFFFPIPEDAAVENVVLLVDGKEFPGKVMNRDEARRIYESIVRAKRDPALLEFAGRGLIKTSVFPIPPQGQSTVTLRCSQLLKRDRDVVTLTYPFGSQKFTAVPIQNLEMDLSIESKTAIKSIYSPSHDINTERRGDHFARVKFRQNDVVPDRDFRLMYTLSDGDVSANVLSHYPSAGDDGFFLLLVSPKIAPADTKTLPKTVVFVLDRSGSMTGTKFEQAQSALKFVIENLKPDDTFNIVAYDDRVESFKPELQRFSDASRQEALRYIENLRPGGSTNIDGALRESLAMIKDDTRPSYLIFLTDGLPTVGETKELPITENCRVSNKNRTRIFAFGVGNDVNSRMLDRISSSNSGTSSYVRPNENIEAVVGSFYSKLTSPVLTDIAIQFGDSDTNRIYPRDIPDLFEGGQLVLSGRYRHGGKSTLTVTGKTGSEKVRYEYPVELTASGRGGGYPEVETLWATRRIAAIIDELDLRGKNSELMDELVKLSTRYGILTPYTSFLADDQVRLHAMGDNRLRVNESLSQLQSLDGESGVMQRDFKARASVATRGFDANDSSAGLGGGGRGGAASAPAAPATARREERLADNRFSLGGRSDAPAAKSASKPSGLGENEKANAEMAKRIAGPASGQKVKRIGSKTFFWKDQRWVDSEVKLETLKAPVVVIEQFSTDYFALVASAKPEWNAYLSLSEPITVQLEVKVYQINPPRDTPKE